jgi:UDP:flavonoid glycosyltransferase YjiC (YdhE family)
VTVEDNKVLFISGSLGLGHIGRDLAIAEEMQRQNRGLTIDWLAASPAAEVVLEAGGQLLPESSLLLDANAIAERMAEGSHLSLIRYAFGARGEWFRNVGVVDRLTAPGGYDLVIGDETYEIVLAYKKDPRRKKAPFVMIYDFVGFDPLTRNPLERLGVYLWNRKWSEGMDRAPTFVDLGLFIGEEEDVPDTTFGPFLPNRRAWARARCQFVGYVLPFDAGQYSDRATLRRRLGYDERPVVVCSIGGTAIGRDLLELCGRAFPLAAGRLPGLRMILVCGPRLSPEGLDVPEGVEVRGYVPALHEHLAASDLAIVQGGGTITLELTALRRPFLYFPIEGHSEQEIHVAGRLARHGAGTRMAYSATSAEALADAMVEHVGSEVRYPAIPVDGAKVAAARIAELL